MTEQEMMEFWAKIGSPGPEHEMLAKQAGEWNVELKGWTADGKPGMEGTGKAEFAMMMGGRVRTEHFHMDMMGMPFEGYGMLGFDNFTRTFWMTWQDNMSTGIVLSRGMQDGNVVTLTGTVNKAVENRRNVPMKNAYRFENSDYFIFEVWENAGTPQEVKTLEIHYRRK